MPFQTSGTPTRTAAGGGAVDDGLERPLTVLLIHDRYLEPGGEELVYESEGRLLESCGHRVVRYEVDNARVAELGSLRLAGRTLWSVEAHREVGRLARAVRPDVAHVHNTLPLLSPSVHHALSSTGTAVVQTLHNYRLLCPQGMLLRDGLPCRQCVGRTPPWPGVVHGCYRDSRTATAAVGAMLTLHRALGTWTKHVDAFITLSAFARDRFVEGGLPAERLHVKPNFIDPDPGVGQGDGGFVLYVGRLAAEKGIGTLLEAWRIAASRGRSGPELGSCEVVGPHRRDPGSVHADARSSPALIVVGDGPLAEDVRDAAETMPGIRCEGRQPRERVLELMGRARALVFPSLCYENSPAVVAEAFARGLPVLATRLGSTAEIVREGSTGRLFAAGDARGLADLVEWALAPSTELSPVRLGARAAFHANHTAEGAMSRLLDIYAAARARRDAEHPG